jgi:predicted flap endonuclease-1-like 5' DNA nuclease
MEEGMRRIAGAWLLFCLIALPRLVDTTAGLLDAGRTGAAATYHRQDVPRANVFPAENSASVSQHLPSRFLSQPLVYFSTAPPESLVLLPGIGPVLAARICDARGGKRLFNTWDDLLRVKGIGDKTVSNFKKLAGHD